jgi:murein DD-endopeptidase MepM/ murein hydrolase activator NlpD
MHLGDTSVKEGETVKAGQQIGTVGTSAGPGKKATSPHLHYEVLKPGRKQERPPSDLAHFDDRMDPEEFVGQLSSPGSEVGLYPGYSKKRG